jgi:hypothetical protein
MRIPLELGGAYWAFNLVSSQLQCGFAVWYYFHAATDSTLDASVVWSAYFSVVFVEFVALAVFFLSMEKKYRKTFYQWQTGPEEAVFFFKSCDDPEVKIREIFSYHETFIAPIKSDIINYLATNWSKWDIEKPDFWTAEFKDVILDDYIPENVRSAEMSRRGGQGARRKSSLLEALQRRRR